MRKLILAFGLLASMSGISAMNGAAQADTLRDAMNKGLHISEVIASAQHDFVATRQSLIITQSANDFNANVNITGSRDYTDSAVISGGFKPSNSKKGTVTLTKRLYDSGEAAAKVKIVEFLLEAAKARYAGTEQDVLLSITNAFLDVITSRESVHVRQVNLERLFAQTEAAEARQQAGTATPNDVAQAESHLARAKSDLIGAQSEQLIAEETYRSLVGEVPQKLTLPSIPGNLPIGILEAETLALAGHPSVQALLATERSALAQFDVLKDTTKPKVDFSLSASVTDEAQRIRDNKEISAALVFTSPLFATPSTHAKSRETSAKHNKARSDTAEAKRKVALGARSAFQSYVAAAAQLDAVASEVQAATLVLEGISAEVEFGLKTFLDELDAQASLNSALLREVQTRQSVLVSAFRLKNAVGQLSASQFTLDSDGLGLDGLSDPESIYGNPFSFFSDIRQ